MTDEYQKIRRCSAEGIFCATFGDREARERVSGKTEAHTRKAG
jgi:hypothetical protein